MKLDWKFLGPRCAKSAGLALAFSVLIHFTSPVHFYVAAAVLLFAWPVTEIIIERIASQNPNAGERVIVKAWWPVAVQYCIVLCATLAVWHWMQLPIMTAFAYSLLVLAAAGAVNGIVIEIEDNAPGGWLNPKGRK